MRSLGKGSLSATTQVKVLSSEIFHFAMGQGFHFLETKISTCAIGEYVSGMPESKSVAGKRIDFIGTWENQNVPSEATKKLTKATRWYGILVVGLIRSRGVNRVTPIAPAKYRALEGISSSMQRERLCYAIP